MNFRTIDEAKAESAARNAALFIVWTGGDYTEWRTDRAGHGGAVVGLPEHIAAFLAAHPHIRAGMVATVTRDCE